MGNDKTFFNFFIRANSKAALTKDLIDGLEKDIEKLKRLEENILRRKIQA